MEKPKPRSKTYLDFHECTNYINKKHNCDTRDFGKRYRDGYNEQAEYLDFWHFVCDHYEIHNGCYITFSEDSLNYYKTSQPDWIVKIYTWYLEEFADASGELEMYVAW